MGKYQEKKREMQLINDNRELNKKNLQAIGVLSTTLKELIEDRKKKTIERNKNQIEQKKIEVDNTDYVDQLCALGEQKRKIKDSSFFSPNTKNAMYTSIKMKKKRLGDKLKEEIKNRMVDNNNDEDSDDDE